MAERMSKRGQPRLLLVEGLDDKRLLPEILERGSGLHWTQDDGVLVFVEPLDGVERLLAPGRIAVELRDSGRRAVGVVLDADHDPSARWRAVRERLLQDVMDLEPNAVPVELPEGGFIANVDAEAPNGPRQLGVWMMPDNRSPGMIETFVRTLVPDHSGALHELAERSCDEAARLEAPFRPSQRDKALLHTWLAWQDPPGRQVHDAVKQRMLDPTLPSGRAFVRWFRELFQL